MTAPDDLRKRLEAAINWYAAKSPMTSPHIATLRAVLAHPEKLMGEPVAYVVRNKTDGSIGSSIAPTGYSLFASLLSKLNDDPWVKIGKAEIAPLYAPAKEMKP